LGLINAQDTIIIGLREKLRAANGFADPPYG
jgi:hypothetical protein